MAPRCVASEGDKNLIETGYFWSFHRPLIRYPALSLTVVVGVIIHQSSLDKAFDHYQNYPNPNEGRTSRNREGLKRK